MSSPDASRIIRRWRIITISVAVLLPLLAIAGTAALALYGSLAPEVKRQVLHDMPQWVVGYPVLVGFNVPFIFLYFFIDSQIRKHWPNIREVQWAAVVAFICLCVPYVFGYYWLPYEMTSGAKDAGQGVGIFLGFMAPIGGALLASIGWRVGKLAGRNIY